MQDIKIPDIGDVDSVEVIELCVAAGDSVTADDPLIVIESDKASMEVPAGHAGVVAELVVALGDTVSEGDVIARLNASTDVQSQAATPQATQLPPDTPVMATPAPVTAQEPQAENRLQQEQPGHTDVYVPDIGDVEEVVVIEVLVKPGEHIEAGDLLVVLESDKASMEVPSELAGTITAVHVSENDPVTDGSLLVTLASTSNEPRAPQAAAQQPVTERVQQERAKSEPVRAAQPDAEQPMLAPEPAQNVESATTAGAQVYAGPAARRLARELGVDLSQVQGSGDKGRILKEDLQDHVKQRLSQSAVAAGGGSIPPIPAVDFSKFGATDIQPLGRTRVVGAQNLHRSWLNIPHVTNHDQADVTELEGFRGSLKAEAVQREVKLTPLAFIVRACIKVLTEFPTVNASLDAAAENFVLKRYYNIGMAVDTPQGLVVPVLHNADQMGIWELSEAISELAAKARARKLSPAEMQGGSFSVSSLGNIGGSGFTPLINPPEVAILGVGRMTMTPVWQDDAFAPRKMLPLSLSYDHRAINGAEAGRFLLRLCNVLGDIRQLIM